MKLLTFAASLSACLAAGCVTSSGTKVTDEQIAAFKPGITSEAEMIAKLGPPNSISTLSDGNKVDSYANATNHANALNFVPGANLFAGGSSQTIDSVSFTFDTHGILKSTASNHGQSNSNHSAAN